MREAEEVEGLRFPRATLPPVRNRKAAELEESRLVGMQREPESREAFAQLGEEASRVLAMLESHDEIVRETHDDHGLRSAPLHRSRWHLREPPGYGLRDYGRKG
jgi:hypothetical protein